MTNRDDIAAVAAGRDLFGDQPLFIPAISMWQPWASLVFVLEPAFRKSFETRSFRYPAKHDGKRIAFHTAAAFPNRRHISADLHDLSARAFGSDYRHSLPLGAIIGTAILDGCEPTENLREHVGFADRAAGVWDNGRYGWRLRDPAALPAPVPTKGKQGWWSVPAELLAVREHLERGA